MNFLRYFAVVALSCVIAWVSADVSHLPYSQATSTEQHRPASPYVFSYQAGRAPGHVDHQHTEVSDGSGVIRGAFSYIDPKNQVRTVQYVADKNGFHPQLSHPVEDSESVKLAKQKHMALYNRIAQEHASAHYNNQVQPSLSAGLSSPQQSGSPQQSEAVIRATNKHLSLYEKIAAEHAAIGRAQEQERLAFQATSENTPYDNGQYRQ